MDIIPVREREPWGWIDCPRDVATRFDVYWPDGEFEISFDTYLEAAQYIETRCDNAGRDYSEDSKA